MSPLEATAVPALRRVPAWPLSESDRNTVTEYLALLALRSPAFRAWHSETSGALLREDRRSGKYAELTDEQWTYAEQYFTGQEFWGDTMARLLSRVASLLGSMQWTLLRARALLPDPPGGLSGRVVVRLGIRDTLNTRSLPKIPQIAKSALRTL